MKSFTDTTRRSLLGGSAMLAAALPTAVLTGAAAKAATATSDGLLDVRRDFDAAGTGERDDSRALQSAIDRGAAEHRPIIVPPGVYKITRPLILPSNTMLMGSAPGLGFGCRIEPHGCAAFDIGGQRPSFHCSIENLMIWPKGEAPDHLIRIDNSYSITFRSLRIHNAPERLGSAAIKLLGAPAAGGHGRCNAIVWDNLIVRNDAGQPRVAIHAAAGCGSHRFVNPCLENFQTLIEWNGGQLDVFAPYTERAGRYGVNCDVEASETDAYFNSFGGMVDCAESGIGCAIRSGPGVFNSFGTVWGPTAPRAVHVYAVPSVPAVFHGTLPNVSAKRKSRFWGEEGWLQGVKFVGGALRASRRWQVSLAGHGTARTVVRVDGVVPGLHWARASLDGEDADIALTSVVSATDEVAVIARNTGTQPVQLERVVSVECGLG